MRRRNRKYKVKNEDEEKRIRTRGRKGVWKMIRRKMRRMWKEKIRKRKKKMDW